MAALLLVEPEADRELEEAVRTYDGERPGLGQRFLNSVEETVNQVRRFPRAGAPVPYLAHDLPARRAPVKGFPYHVVYLVTADALRILAFAHYRRRPGYWTSRHGASPRTGSPGTAAGRRGDAAGEDEDFRRWGARGIRPGL